MLQDQFVCRAFVSAAMLLTAAASVARAGDAPPPRDRYRPGQLSDAEKRKVQTELTGKAIRERLDPRRASAQAAQQHRERIERLEREAGIYDVTTVLDNGDVSKRVDVVVVTSGFPKSAARKVIATVEMFKTALLKQDPFRNYPAYINFHRVLVDDAGDIEKARVPAKVTDNVLRCSDSRKARDYAGRAPDCDLVVVLCNVTRVRSTGGGGLITVDADMDMGHTFLHEMGHAFSRLADEYVERQQELIKDIPAEDSPWMTNASKVGDPKKVKWHYWIPELWRAAHQENRLPKGHKVGCFEGACGHATGVYRPEANCLMRMGQSFCVVCFEHVEKCFYSLLSPIDDARPHHDAIALWLDETVTLEADAIRTVGEKGPFGRFEGFWYVDGASTRPSGAKGLTTTLTLAAKALGPGVHDAALRVDFCNDRVRRDHGWLSSTHAWTIDVGKHPRPVLKPIPAVKAPIGKPVDVEIAVAQPEPGLYKIEAKDLPPGATFENGRFAWTPEKAHQGAWRPRIVVSDGPRLAEKSFDIAVVDPAESLNLAPVLPPLEPLSVAEGKALEFPVDAMDVDGDNLVYASPNLPEGATLGVYDGVLRWTPGSLQAGRYPKIAIEISDGLHQVKGTLDIVVEDRPPARIKGIADLRQALRSASGRTRAEALGKLDSAPKTFQVLESARLLRDREAAVRKAALERVRSLAASADETFLALLVKDLTPHAWHFTDDAEALAWLGELAGREPATRERKLLNAELKGVAAYNKIRGVGQ